MKELILAAIEDLAGLVVKHQLVQESVMEIYDWLVVGLMVGVGGIKGRFIIDFTGWYLLTSFSIVSFLLFIAQLNRTLLFKVMCA